MAPDSLLFQGIAAQRVWTRAVVGEVTKGRDLTTKPPLEIIVHALSNNGGFVLLRLREVLCASDARARIVAVVADSCPGDLSLSTLFGAVSAGPKGTATLVRKGLIYGSPLGLLGLLAWWFRKRPGRLLLLLGLLSAVHYLRSSQVRARLRLRLRARVFSSKSDL